MVQLSLSNASFSSSLSPSIRIQKVCEKVTFLVNWENTSSKKSKLLPEKVNCRAPCWDDRIEASYMSFLARVTDLFLTINSRTSEPVSFMERMQVPTI